MIALVMHDLTKCHVCGGDGRVYEVEEYLAGLPRYEQYPCRWCKGKKALHVRKRCRPCQRGSARRRR